DELGRTQNGNNNPWALDSVAMRNNYAAIPTNAPQAVPVEAGVPAEYNDNLGTYDTDEHVNDQFRFAAFVANLRHRHPALQQSHYGDLIPDDEDVSYLFHASAGGELGEGHRAVAVHINSPGDDFFVMVNMADFDVDFVVPEAPKGWVWRRLIDTGEWAEPACNHWPEGEGKVVAGNVVVPPWTVVVWHQSATSGDAMR
ncbi:MAG TPA: glycogen-debranching protein, partial [Arachnia sp.]|nr:glycogen-debranching protein [Arachnia sp.]